MGEYVQNGDVFEWHWAEGEEPVVNVPKGEFDPRSAPPLEPSVAEGNLPKAEEPKKATKK